MTGTIGKAVRVRCSNTQHIKRRKAQIVRCFDNCGRGKRDVG
jgi:hypothetical protein